MPMGTVKKCILNILNKLIKPFFLLIKIYKTFLGGHEN